MDRLEQYINYYNIDRSKLEREINWERLSLNPYLTPQMIEKYVDYWDWVDLSANPALTPELMKKYRKKLYMPNVGANPSIDEETFIDFWETDVKGESTHPPNPPYDFNEESIEDRDYWLKNPSLTERMFEHGKYSMEYGREKWSDLSANRGLTPHMIEKYKDSLHFADLADNPALTAPLIERYWDKIMDAYEPAPAESLIPYTLSSNPNLTPAMIEEYWFKPYEDTPDSDKEFENRFMFTHDEILRNSAFTWPMIKRFLALPRLVDDKDPSNATTLNAFGELAYNPNMTPSRVIEWQYNFGKEKEHSRSWNNFFHDTGTIETYFEQHPMSLQEFKRLKKTIRNRNKTAMNKITKTLARNIFLTPAFIRNYHQTLLPQSATIAQNPSFSYDLMVDRKNHVGVDMFHYMCNPAFLTDVNMGTINHSLFFNYDNNIKLIWYLCYGQARAIRYPYSLVANYYSEHGGVL